MVRAWYVNDEGATLNPHLENHLNPPELIPMDKVFEKTGVEYFKINLETYRSDGVLEGIRQARGYNYEDEITCSDSCVSDLETMLKRFYDEHLHGDEEIRLVMAGGGYFDVRDKSEKWIRIFVESGDMIILPSGIFHRFTLDSRMFITAKRYFIGNPVWVAHSRSDSSSGQMEARKEYLKRIHTGS